MSITISGVKGYEYQYSATVFIALNIGLNNIKSLFVEKKGSEDIFIQIIQDSVQIDVEIQIKSEKSIIDISKLGNWLTHFQEKSVDNNLLHRLETSNQFALFITKSRCDDDSVKLKKTIPDISFHRSISINKEWNQKFKQAITKYSDSTNTLKTSRKKFCSSQGITFNNKANTVDVLKRVIIWEEVSEDSLRIGIQNLLNKKYSIPQSQTDFVEFNLLDIVRKGRDEQVNIISHFKNLIDRKRAAAPIVNPGYRKRPDEDILFQELQSKNLLLLTGNTLCGKSELAKQLAFRLFVEGYNYSIHTDLQGLTQFFAQNPIEDKIAILEDPWGHLEQERESLTNWRNVDNFLSNVSPHHKLIITSRKEIIQSMHSSLDINSKTKLKGSKWHDLTLSDSNFLINYWRFISQEMTLQQEVVQNIESHLLNSIAEEKLQIGQLKFLSGIDESDLVGKTANELDHIARMNSQEVGESIRKKNQDLGELMALLALTCTTTTSINKREISYILSNDEHLYAKIKKGFWTSGFNEGAEYPKYNQEYILTDQTMNHLEYLERRFFIIDKDDNIFFTHPNYFEAGRHLFTDSSNAGQNRFLGRLEKALFAIHPDTAFLAANQFTFLFKKLSTNYLPKLIEKSFEGTNSIYPAVEDRLIVFLIEIMDQLRDEQKDIFISKLETGGTPTSHIFWHENSIPFISSDSSRGLEEYFFKLDKEQITNLETSFQKHDIVSSYAAWQYLLTVRNTHQIKISSEILETLVQYREVFLRRLAAFTFIRSQGRKVNINSLNRIFSDEHPSVVFEGIRGCFMEWRSFPQNTKDKLIPLLKDLINRRPVAIRANHLMTTFERDYNLDSIDWKNMNEEEKKELWNLWGSLFLIFIRQLPSNVYLNPGRFGLTMEKSLKFLDYELGLTVLEAWYERIDYRIKCKGDPDEYEMAVAEDLMIFTKKDHISRANLFDKLVSYPSTSFLISNLKWLVEHWADMHDTEKKRILQLVISDREDIRWIKAVLLNSYSPPAEIQNEILGHPNFLELEIKHVVENFPAELLLDCLHVYLGHPQPLWWLAVHHHNIGFWGKIIRLVLYKKKDPYFSLCLRELLNNGVNGFSPDWRDGFKIWKTLCRRPRKKTEQAKCLIYATASSTCSIHSTKKLWKYLIKSYQRENNEKELISLIVEHIEVLQQTGDKEDLINFWGKEFFFKKIYPEIFPDQLLIKLVEQVVNLPELQNSVIKSIAILNEQKLGFRFYYTSFYFDYLKRKKLLPEELEIVLQSIPHHYITVGEENYSLMSKELQEDISLKNWVI